MARYHSPFIVDKLKELARHTESLAAEAAEAWAAYLRDLAAHYDAFRDVALALAAFDCLSSLAVVAAQPTYCRPELLEGDAAGEHVVDGRHPMVEAVSREAFVPNDTHLGGDGCRVHIITGPNMGGKSSYVRQVRVLARSGGFSVAGSIAPALRAAPPRLWARRAGRPDGGDGADRVVCAGRRGAHRPRGWHLHPVRPDCCKGGDAALCTRAVLMAATRARPFGRAAHSMGASDDLAKGHSTFMMEMQEAADIIRLATPRSLVILDELGRGTSTHDGVAIAYATLHHFVTVVRSLTLFVTHYPSLAELQDKFPQHVRNYHMSFITHGEGAPPGQDGGGDRRGGAADTTVRPGRVGSLSPR